MKPSDLPRWVEMAASEGADRLEVRRARTKGKTDPKLFFEVEIEGLDHDEFCERLRDDTLSARKLPRAEYEVSAHKGKTEVRKERIIIERSDLGGENIDDPQAALVSVAIREMHGMAKTMIDGAERISKQSVAVSGVLAAALEKMGEREGEMMGVMYDVVKQSREQAAEEQKSADRREMGKTAITELSPILGAIAMKLGRRSGPGLIALFQSIKDKQLEQLQAILTPEQFGLLSDVVTELNAEKEKAKKGG